MDRTGFRDGLFEQALPGQSGFLCDLRGSDDNLPCQRGTLTRLVIARIVENRHRNSGDTGCRGAHVATSAGCLKGRSCAFGSLAGLRSRPRRATARVSQGASLWITPVIVPEDRRRAPFCVSGPQRRGRRVNRVGSPPSPGRGLKLLNPSRVTAKVDPVDPVDPGPGQGQAREGLLCSALRTRPSLRRRRSFGSVLAQARGCRVVSGPAATLVPGLRRPRALLLAPGSGGGAAEPSRKASAA